MYQCFSALFDHSVEQRTKFAQKKSTILQGSKYASRTLRNEQAPHSYDDEEEYYSEDQRV